MDFRPEVKRVMGSVARLVWPAEPQPQPQQAEGFETAPATIGDLIDTGRGLAATCEVCLHSARLDLKDLAMRLGASHSCSEKALRPKLQCSVCKSVDATLQEIRPRHGAARPNAGRPIPDYV